MTMRQITLPVTGMTCANCAVTIERNLRKLPTVANANVNLASERASLEFDPATLKFDDIVARIVRAGYGVALGEAVLPIRRMSDDTDARRLEKALAKLEGVPAAQVNFAAEKAVVSYIPTLVSQADLRRVVGAVGLEVAQIEGDAEDFGAHRPRERDRPPAPSAHRRPALYRAAVPALDGARLRAAGGLGGDAARRFGARPRPSALVQLAAVCAGDAGAVLCGPAILRGRLQGAAQRRGQHGRADRPGQLGGLLLLAAGAASAGCRATSILRPPR